MKTPFLFAVVPLAAILAGCASSQKPIYASPAPPAAPAKPAPAAAPAPADKSQHVVRYWHEEKAADGRPIMVAEDWLVDPNGRMIRKLK